MATTSGLCKVSGRVLKIGTSSSIEEIILPDTVDFTQFEQGIVALSGDNNPITRLTREYGEESFYLSVAAVNSYFARDEVKSLITERDQPILYDRTRGETIFTPIEVANFIISSGYTPSTLSVATSVVSLNLVNQFESFYTANFTRKSMGGFCSILPNIFGAVGAFFTTLQTLSATINSLKNFALNFSLSALLSQLKEKILGIIDSVVSKVKSTLENFSLARVTSELVQKAIVIREDIFANFQRTKTSCLSFCDKENVDNYKSGIEKLIDYAMSLFKNPTIEDVQFLLYRFCGFAGLIENAISGLTNPLDNAVSSYAAAVSTLQSNSSRNTSRAQRAGAVRYDNQVRQSGINTGQELYQQAGNPPPLTAEDYEDITPWNDGKGDNRITFSGNSFRDTRPGLGRECWEQLNPRVKTQLMKLQKEFGKQLILVSAFRPRWYNDELRARGVAAAKNSLHIAKIAVDVSWSGFNNATKEEFIRAALRNGFTGIGRYSSFVHVDIGPRREW
jgi:hypothetical protein